MLYLIISLFFGLNCDEMQSRLYNAEREFNAVQFCQCISGDALSDYKSQAKKELNNISRCDSLEDRADSLWKKVKKLK